MPRKRIPVSQLSEYSKREVRRFYAAFLREYFSFPIKEGMQLARDHWAIIERAGGRYAKNKIGVCKQIITAEATKEVQQ